MLKLIIKGITVTQEGTPWVTALVVYCVVLNTEFGKPCDSLIWFYFQTFVNIYFMHILWERLGICITNRQEKNQDNLMKKIKKKLTLELLFSTFLDLIVLPTCSPMSANLMSMAETFKTYEDLLFCLQSGFEILLMPFCK